MFGKYHGIWEERTYPAGPEMGGEMLLWCEYFFRIARDVQYREVECRVLKRRTFFRRYSEKTYRTWFGFSLIFAECNTKFKGFLVICP